MRSALTWKKEHCGIVLTPFMEFSMRPAYDCSCQNVDKFTPKEELKYVIIP